MRLGKVDVLNARSQPPRDVYDATLIRRIEEEYETRLEELVANAAKAAWQEYLLKNGVIVAMAFGTTCVTYQIVVDEADLRNLPERDLRFYWRQKLQPVFDKLFATIMESYARP